MSSGACRGYYGPGHRAYGRRRIASQPGQAAAEETGMPVIVAENPLDCVAIGTGKALENIHLFKSRSALPSVLNGRNRIEV